MYLLENSARYREKRVSITASYIYLKYCFAGIDYAPRCALENIRSHSRLEGRFVSTVNAERCFQAGTFTHNILETSHECKTPQ